jgi:hypothetical protein
VCQKQLEKKLVDAGLSANVETGHFGAIAELDKWKDAAGLILIGRPQAGPLEFGVMAATLSGELPLTVSSNAQGWVWYPRVEGAIRLSDGTGRALTVYRPTIRSSKTCGGRHAMAS